MPAMNDRVREAVKAKMKARGLSQQQLGELTGIERTNINALLNGKTGKVSERWQKVLDALDLDLDAVNKEAE